MAFFSSKGYTQNFIGNLKRLLVLGLAFVMSFSCVSCARKDAKGENVIQVYYVNKSETGIVSNDYELCSDPEDVESQIAELIKVLRQMPDRHEYEAPMAGTVDLLNYTVKDKLLTLNFAASYTILTGTIEILDRAAIVRTFTQLPAIDYVSFQIDGKPLTDHSGNVIGNMSADTFVYNAGNEINTYEKVQIKLYFAGEDGKKLSPVYRSVVYNSNISMERLAVEQLISGPNTNIAFATISKDTKIKSISVKDGTCYVDFDAAFLYQPNHVTCEVAIYSIVNTLTELPYINKVVFSVGGVTGFTYMDSIISGSYERNLDIL